MKIIQDEITSKDIIFNGVKITCHSDGSITCYNKLSGKPVRSFGTPNTIGYRQRSINGSNQLCHRLIAIAFLGEDLEGRTDVDHINGNINDNRPENLRYLTHSQNLRGARKPHGNSKFRGVSKVNKKFRAFILGKHIGMYDTEIEAAENFDDVAYYKHNYPIEGLNFPDRILDKVNQDEQSNIMENREDNIERIQTQIEMIRAESRLLTYRIERMTEQRKKLSEEKRQLKSLLLEMG